MHRQNLMVPLRFASAEHCNTEEPNSKILGPAEFPSQAVHCRFAFRRNRDCCGISPSTVTSKASSSARLRTVLSR